MKTPRLLLTRRIPDTVERRLAARYHVIQSDKALSPESAHALLAMNDNIDGLVVSPSDILSKPVIDRLPASVKIIACYSVGTDHIDLEQARLRQITVTNTPDVLTDATAEIAMLLMLGVARRAIEGDRMVQEGKWKSWSPTGFLGTQLTGKTLGIVGMGRIGQAVAHRARAFGMRILYHNRQPLPSAVAGDAGYVASLEELLPRCDVLSLHCPATSENQNMLNARRLALLPDHAIVVNTARGSLIDDQALIAELKTGRLRAGLDVFNNEPNIDPAYRGLDNCFLLPHVGSATIETRTAMGMRCADNLDAFFAGHNPPHRVV